MTAIVTGAGSGIGRATAELLLSRGEAVVGVDLDPAGIPDGALALAGDVSTEETNAAMVAAAVERFGSLNTLVLNAGIAPTGSLARADGQVIDRVLAVNLRSVALGIAAAVPHLERAATPAIVTVASISGMRGEPTTGIYAASKAGVINLTRSAAVELGPRGIRANCVCPGPTETPMTMPAMEADPVGAAYVRRTVPLKRFAAPEEIATVIAFLASSAASFVNGAVVAVDGGLTANVGQEPPPDA